MSAGSPRFGTVGAKFGDISHAHTLSTGYALIGATPVAPHLHAAGVSVPAYAAPREVTASSGTSSSPATFTIGTPLAGQSDVSSSFQPGLALTPLIKT